MLFTPDERRALFALLGLLTLGLIVRVLAIGFPPEGGSDALLSLAEAVHEAAPVDSAIRPMPPRPASTGAPPAGLVEEGRIRVNEAGVDDLVGLPGVGPVLAARIVEERQRGGPFRSRVDLQRVRGIGPRTAEKLEPRISFVPPAAAGDDRAQCNDAPRGARASPDPPDPSSVALFGASE